MYIRVSEILARLQTFPTHDPIALDNRNKKGVIGTNVHNAVLSDAVGDFPLLNTEREAAYFGSYKMWQKKEKPVFKMQVPRLYDDELMITGEIDGLVQGAMAHPYLVDWKCSASPNEQIWEMQLHFYWYLLKQNRIEVAPNMKLVNFRHKKWVENDENGDPVARYSAIPPRVYDFSFKENVLSHCIDEAHKAWTEKKDALVLDF